MLWLANAFSSNLNTIHLKIFPNPGRSLGRVLLFLWSQKGSQFQKIYWTVVFLPWLSDCFNLPDYNSELRKRYTLRFLLCLKRQKFGKFFCLGCGGKWVSWERGLPGRLNSMRKTICIFLYFLLLFHIFSDAFLILLLDFK